MMGSFVFWMDDELIFSANAVTEEVENQIANQVNFRNILMYSDVSVIRNEMSQSENDGRRNLLKGTNVEVVMRINETLASSPRFLVYVRDSEGNFQSVQFVRSGDTITFSANDLAAILIVEITTFYWWLVPVILGVLILIFVLVLIMTKKKNFAPASGRMSSDRRGAPSGRSAPKRSGGGRDTGRRQERPAERRARAYDRDPFKVNKKQSGADDVVYMNDPDLHFNHNTSAHNVHFNGGAYNNPYNNAYGNNFAQQQQQAQQSVNIYETIEVEETDMFRTKPKY
jgi:hypothetical protein